MPEHVEPSSADGAACSAPVPDGVRRQVPDVVPSDADVAACLRVLDALAARPAAFQSPAHRDLRAATRRARDALAQTDFGGGDGLAYGRRRQLRKERRRDRASRRPGTGGTATRRRCRGRIERLRELTERNGRLALAAACYSCKARFGNLHHFYASLCPTCAALNWRMRHASASLEGRVALVTGARVKIGFEIGCKLLRAGATLVATTRFPADALDRYARLDDFEAFGTAHRPPPAAYYRGLADRRGAPSRRLGLVGGRPWHAAADAAPASELSQLRVAPEDSESALGDALPAGAVDVNGQQLDNRTRNSWTLKLRDVSAPEVVEAMAINAVAPFILNAPPAPPRRRPRRQAFVANVSAMEGKFYRHKTPNHPHTNMAKAALNMMTRTTAAAGFQTPIDEVDAAARVCHPIFHGVETGAPLFGVFLKDHVECEW
ncbi:short chain dehydrogenase [Aureococcus anophagefferens]|nr:short chain dehydrogenase [Aureococcus anophagefferens]